MLSRLHDRSSLVVNGNRASFKLLDEWRRKSRGKLMLLPASLRPHSGTVAPPLTWEPQTWNLTVRSDGTCLKCHSTEPARPLKRGLRQASETV